MFVRHHSSVTHDATEVPILPLNHVTCVNICVALSWLLRQMLCVNSQPSQTRGLGYKQATVQVLRHALELPQQK